MPVDEIIICDDKSKDNTVKVVEEFISKKGVSDIINISVNEENLGYASNFISAVKKTTGDLIFFCDQDDIWSPEKIEMGRKLYYFHKDSGLEVDFVIRYKGKCTLVEVKAATGNAKSTKTILRHPEKYHVESAIKLGDYNIGRSEQILTLPLYMAFLLRAF